MKTFEKNGITVNVIDIDNQDEIEAYVDHAVKQYGTALTEITLRLDPDDSEYICMSCKIDEPFERIRRITGYLVGTLDRFNDAKKSEEHDRVKHKI